MLNSEFNYSILMKSLFNHELSHNFIIIVKLNFILSIFLNSNSIFILNKLMKPKFNRTSNLIMYLWKVNLKNQQLLKYEINKNFFSNRNLSFYKKNFLPSDFLLILNLMLIVIIIVELAPRFISLSENLNFLIYN